MSDEIKNTHEEELPEEVTPKTKPKQVDLTKELYDWAQALAFSIIFIVFLFTFVVRIIGVDGSSMEPTLHHMDKIVLSNILYTPKKGDIVVLRMDSFMDKPIVKRVIATGGDTININYKTHEVYVNGQLLDEPYIKDPISVSGDFPFPAVVPEGSIFVLGDNRNNSSDSRYLRLGMVDNRTILGKVIFRIFPADSIGTVG